jgi:gamma-glutamyltranspeptidase/glutathione hydrolase
MVAAAQPLAVEAGLRALRDGGSAVDAALACNAVLAVVEPCSCGLGGDLFALLWDPGAEALAGLDASGRSPAAATVATVETGPDGLIPLRSPSSWSVPGAVDGWFALHARYGRLPAARLLEDAVHHAREGFPVTEVIARQWALGERAHASTAGFGEVFLPDGRAPREGELFRNPSLARTLERISDAGPDGFYRGETAEELVAYSREQGGLFALDDLASTRSSWVEPVSATWGAGELWELPPAGQGLAALQMLNVAEALGVRDLDRHSADWWHLLVEAKKIAWADRARWYADPEFARLPLDDMLSKDYARRRAGEVDRGRAASAYPAGDFRAGLADTTYLAAADADGMMVSWIQSNFTGFGSGHAVPSLGFGLQNRGGLFSLDPDHPNALAPRKRPFHTIIPGFATKQGEPWLAFGVMGGDMQPQGHVQVLLNLLDHDMNLQEAGDAARFHHGGPVEPTGARSENGGSLSLEPGVPAAIRDELGARGHRVEDAPWRYGGYQAVARDTETGALEGATESRKDGCALGF